MSEQISVNESAVPEVLEDEIHKQPPKSLDAPVVAELTTEKSRDTEGENPAANDRAPPIREDPAAKVEEEEDEEDEAEEEEPEDGVPIVLVTGASGFIATHLIKQLLEQGRYHVRGSVRSKKREEKVDIKSSLSSESVGFRSVESIDYKCLR